MSDWRPKRCVVFGASGGIGSAFVSHLLKDDNVDRVYGFSRSSSSGTSSEKLIEGRFDYIDPMSIERDAELVQHEGPVDLVIVATGLLHADDGFGPEKSLRQLDSDQLARAYLVNAIGPMLVAKSFLPLLHKEERSVFAALSARVGSISDNRIGGWYGYRAAKAGLNQMLRTASIEHARRWPQSVVVGLHPGTVDSSLSRPFQKNVAPGKLFTATDAAADMLNVLMGLSPSDTGKVFAYDGSEVPA